MPRRRPRTQAFIEKNRVSKQITRLIHNLSTEQVYLDGFSRVKFYIADKFPKVSLDHIKIFTTSQRAMQDAGLGGAAGVYVHHLKTVIVQRDPTMGSRDLPAHTFYGRIARSYCCQLRTEDVLVHEMMHAVSGEINRSSRRYTNAEEEFVYTNCVDFYRYAMDMPPENVINMIMPFIIKNKIKQAVDKVPSGMDKERYLNRHQDEIVPRIVASAKEMCQHMINCYEGKPSDAVQPHEHPMATRFRGMDLHADL